MNVVQNYPLSCTTAMTSTSGVYLGNTEQIILNIPNELTSVWASGVIAFSLLGSNSASGTYTQVNFWDYGNSTPKSCVVTASTGGMYELPNAGGVPFVKIQWDTATTKATAGLSLLTPRTTY